MLEKLAREIYHRAIDMDYLDYEDTRESDIQDIARDLELLEKLGNGALLNGIEMILANTAGGNNHV